MRYLGGKTRIAKYIAAEIDKIRAPGQWVWDPFCGGLSVSVALSKKGPVWSTDACVPLISLYQAIRSGWEPPDSVSQEEYEKAKSLPDSDPFKAYAGFCAVFGGKYFGGYARGENRNYAAEGKRSLLRDVPRIRKIQLVNFLDSAPRLVPCIIYCDPPYSGTTGYSATGKFNSQSFIEKVKNWSTFTDVFVSEYDFPLGGLVFEKNQLKRVGPGDLATERLYYIAKGSL